MSQVKQKPDNNTEATFVVGIDLGTTHTVVAYASLLNNAADPVEPARIFEIEQLVAPGTVAKKPLLPSFRYHPTAGEISDGDIQLPWTPEPVKGEINRVIIGEWARELGAKVEGRLVVSAKSWLSHTQVDRNAPILPWAAVDDVEKVSPVVASASYLNYVRQAWNHEHKDTPLEKQVIIITIPASFDESARALTVAAAAMAGLPSIMLLEEPQAVCYDWYARNKATATAMLQDTQLILISDIGGGTTDLSLISVAIDSNDQLILNRVGVGDHLMLGGDNIDLALAHIAEQRITQGGKKLNAASMSQLIQQTRLAKELLLSDNAPDTAKVTVLGAGARLIGGSKSCLLSKDEVQNIALNGFFPLTNLDEQPKQRRRAVVEFGLPYAADPAISKHIAAFILQHQVASRKALSLAESDIAIPQALLLNGGVFNSSLVKDRTTELLNHWQSKPVLQLANAYPDLAVAFGAVAYGQAKQSNQMTIGGGAARNYFLLLDNVQKEQTQQAVCLLPQGSEENVEFLLEDRLFTLKVGQPVSFNLISSPADNDIRCGDIIDLIGDHYTHLPPLVAVLKSQDHGQHLVKVNLITLLTAVGTLQLNCADVAEPNMRWNLEFEIRKDTQTVQRANSQSITKVPLPPKFDEAIEKIALAYGKSKKQTDPKAIKTLRSDLEKLLGTRDDWQLPVLRELFLTLNTGQKRRRRTDVHERVWCNLAGFTLRPGYGYPTDEWAIEQVWPIYREGLQHVKETSQWAEWWTLWRRIAGGLNEDQQLTIYDDIAPLLDPEQLNNRKVQQQCKRKSVGDMVRLIGALENLPFEAKIQLGYWLLERLHLNQDTEASWWSLARLGARIPFYGSTHNTVPVKYIHDWLPNLLAVDWTATTNAAFAAMMLCRMTGDRSRDIDDHWRHQIAEKLVESKCPTVWLDMVNHYRELDEVESQRIFGESLPLGLQLVS